MNQDRYAFNGSQNWYNSLGDKFFHLSSKIEDMYQLLPSNLFPDVHLRETCAHVQQGTCTTMFWTAVFITAQNGKQSKCL